MSWYNNSNLWILTALVVILVIGIIMYNVSAPTPAEPLPQQVVGRPVVRPAETMTSSYQDYNFEEETNIEDLGEPEDEQFGMYESALASWLEHHPSNGNVDNYTRSK